MGSYLSLVRPGTSGAPGGLTGAALATKLASMAHRVRSHLRLAIDDYDETIRRFIPGYDTMLAEAARAVAAVRPGRVVDLGAGTGALSEAVLEQEGVGEAELLDVDPEMLQRARARLARFGERVRFSLRSYAEPLPRCDVFTASLSLHHIRDLDDKAAFFARLFESLAGGGLLVNADVCMPEEGAGRDELYFAWAEHMVAEGIPRAQAWRHFEEWAEEDRYFPLEAELEALRRAGFRAERTWNRGAIGVVVARKG